MTTSEAYKAKAEKCERMAKTESNPEVAKILRSNVADYRRVAARLGE